VREHLRSGRLVEVLADFTLPGPSLYAAYVKHAGTPRMRPLLQYLEAALRVDGAQQAVSASVPCRPLPSGGVDASRLPAAD
jgi:hypothetical protein